jgi:hypothetical protein
MVLSSRSTTSRLLPSNKGEEIPNDDDNSKRKRGAHRYRHYWHRIVRSDTRLTRYGVVMLLLVNLLIYFGAPPSCSDDALSSFASWRQHTNIAPQEAPNCYQGSTFRFWRSTRRSRFPSVQQRARFYMGTKWWEPKLQGVPPTSPFGAPWNERWLASFKTRRRQDGSDDAMGPVQPLLGMDPQNLYDCSMGKLIISSPQQSCRDNVNRQQLAHAVMDAALLVEEFQRSSSWKHFWNVWRYEGILGIYTEWHYPLPSRSTGVSPPYLWNTANGVSIATTLWNTATPVFGRVRDVVADQDEQYFRNQRRSTSKSSSGSAVPVHATILWPLDRQHKRKELVLQVAHNDPTLSWDQKDGTNLYWRGDTSVGNERRAYAEYYRTSKVIDIAHSVVSNNDGQQRIEQSQHRYLLVLEGGMDVPDDLLRKLYTSNLVVFMPEPITYTSWAMESLLKPYVHYIPVTRTNLEEQLKWAKDHQEVCKIIASQSTLWVHDLLSHPQSMEDEQEIMRIIIHRYEQFVVRAKPIVKWSHLWEYFTVKGSTCTAWFEQDWLRVAFLVVLLCYARL